MDQQPNASGDTFAQFIQGNITLQQAKKSIEHEATSLGVETSEYAQVLQTYFICEAGAYEVYL